MEKDYDASQDPNYIDKFLIGTINFTESINEQEVGNKDTRTNFGKKIGEVKIEVYGGEGAIPHFHIVGVNSKFQSCVCIHSPNYFAHGGKYKDTLNSKQRETLNNWLKESNILFNTFSNWETINRIWEGSNPNCKFPDSRKVDIQPDYSKMEQFKDN